MTAPLPGEPVGSAGRSAALDLLVVGAGPTGIAVGAEAMRAGLAVLVVDRGALTDAILHFPTFMTFFTTRDLLEIAGVPFAIPEDKPDRRQALAYYRAVAAQYRLPLALHEEVVKATRQGSHPDYPKQTDTGFEVETTDCDRPAPRRHLRRARAVVLATGYFGQPKRLGVPGEDLPSVHSRFREAHPHFGEDVVVVGGGNSAAEVALELWRHGARVTLVHRGAGLKPTVKYWVKPDLENRIAEGAIAARFGARVLELTPDAVTIESAGRREVLPAAAAYVLIGYRPDVALQSRCGIEVDPETLVPRFDPETCETNVPALYVAGTLQAGRDTGKIFIENSRADGLRIVRHVVAVRALHGHPSR